MEEVPPSPEIVKHRKRRRKHGSSFSRLSFQHTTTISNDPIHSVEKSTRERVQLEAAPENTLRRSLSAFYSDDSCTEIETVHINPLTAAILLEKANAIPPQNRVPSPDFIAATDEEFLSVAELAERNTNMNAPEKQEYDESNVKKHNYSFTQLELSSQMINIFEAAELLVSSATEARPKPPEEAERIPYASTKENISELTSPHNQGDHTCERNIVQTILDDFSEDEDFNWKVDFSLIKAKNIHQRLRQLQDHISSPPRVVKRETVCRQYGNVKRERKDTIVRRLSYGTDCSSKVEQPLTDDDSTTPSETDDRDSEDAGISMDGVALNESILIQANLTQLSAFFSQAIASDTQRQNENDERHSVDDEPTFYGFSPEPMSPISLATSGAHSPETVRFEFKPFDGFLDNSLQTAEDVHVQVSSPNCARIDQLLEEDDDLFMLAHPGNVNFELIPEDKFYNNGTGTIREPSLETGLTKDLLGFLHHRQTSILKPRTMAAVEGPRMLQQSNERLGVKNEKLITESVQTPAPGNVLMAEAASVMTAELSLPRIATDARLDVNNAVSVAPYSMGQNATYPEHPLPTLLTFGFKTAAGTKVSISEAALAKARSMFAEDEAKGDNGIAISESSEKKRKIENQSESVDDLQPVAGEFSTTGGGTVLISKQALTRRNDEEAFKFCSKILPAGGGFSTAGGSKITVSRMALERAQMMFDEEDPNTMNQRPSKKSLPLGFSTAGGSAISISKEALAKAQSIFNDEELNTGKENLSENVSGGLGIVGGKNITALKNLFERAEMMCDVGVPDVPNQGSTVVSQVNCLTEGFRTAAGSTIAVSKEALDKAKSLFDENEEETEVKSEQTEPLPRNSPPRMPIDGKDNSFAVFCNAQSVDVHPENKSCTLIGGFSSASGKRMQVSEVALAKARLLFEQVEQELVVESSTVAANAAGHHKRKPSSIHDEPTTPAKRPRTTVPLQSLGRFETSTPASNSTSNYAPKLATTHHEVDHFFAELDDEEFEDLFRNQQPPPPDAGTKKQKKLLFTFEQCAEEAAKPEEDIVTNNTSTSHWDDSFTEILPKLPSDEQSRKEAVRPSEDVRRRRMEELQRQRDFAEAKPDELRRARVSSFCRKKCRADRIGLAAFVGESKPMVAADLVTNAAIGVTLSNVRGFRFDMAQYYGEGLCISNFAGIRIGSDGEAVLLMDQYSSVGLEEMSQCFLAASGIDGRLLPSGWVENAWRWIVSKLAALERNLNGHFRGALTPENVFHQLQYRYHVEIDSARRPPLRKMLEKDDIASRRMVLFVSDVFRVGDGTCHGVELELSDGWYAVRTSIDVALAAAVRAGKIAIGTKLMIQSGELINHRDGCSPLEVPPEVRLRIHANSTRRVRWPVKLGYYRCPMPFVIPCNGIHERGGLIGCFLAFVVRVYPLVYVEKMANETRASVLRSERMQQRHSRRNDANQLDRLHRLYNQIQQEIESERTSAGVNRNVRVTDSTSCSQLQELLEAGLDVSFLDMELTLSQQAVIQRFQQQRQEELQHEINCRVKAKMGQHSGRSSVTSLLKVRLMDHVKPNRTFLLSVWRPTDDVRLLMQEQTLLELHNITANGTKNHDVQLTANKSSSYAQKALPSGIGEQLTRFTRSITPIGDIDPPSFRPPFNEFDTLGVVVHVASADSKKFQTIYLADTAMQLLCVNFWHGLAEYAYDDVVLERVILSVSNLQWRTVGRHNQAIAQSFATEYTTFTANPRDGLQRTEWDRFQLQLDAIDREEFFQRCREKVHELQDITAPGTPTIGNCSTPLQRSRLGLIQPQQSTPLGTGAGGSIAKRKIDKLATIYGSPPKLSPIVIRSNPTLRKGFKTPARMEPGEIPLAASAHIAE